MEHRPVVPGPIMEGCSELPLPAPVGLQEKGTLSVDFRGHRGYSVWTYEL